MRQPDEPSPEQLREDFESRWRRGDRAVVEDYLERWPALHTREDALLQLIRAEVALRAEAGEQPREAEYHQRFPQEAAAITRLFEHLPAPDPGGFTHPTVSHEAPEPPPAEAASSAPPVDAATLTPPPAPAPPVKPPSRRKRRIPPPPIIPGHDILDYLGGGGQGDVWQAKHLRLDRLVALKILKAEEDEEEQLARFHREGKLYARLEHPNIIRIHDYAEHAGRLYLSMEYAEGGTLQERLDREGRIAPEGAAALLAVLADAVQYAHEQGIIHRDLKPGNILFTRDGTLKVTDFGLAKRIGADATKLTQTRVIMGTASFMSPEQAAGLGRQVTPSADIYALGAILYTVLVGAPPFESKDWLEVLVQVRTMPPEPPSQRQPDVSGDIERICLKCLEKDPIQRYRSAREMADDLRRFLAAGTIATAERTLAPRQIDELVADSPSSSGPAGSALESKFPAGSALVRRLIAPVPSPEQDTVDFAQPARRAPQAPDHAWNIPGYEVLGEIGRGGMGVVYKARQLSLNRIVALKTIRGPTRAEEWQRLRMEAESVASLQHPHILSVYDLGTHEDRLYIAMEFAEGGSLRERIKAGVQPEFAAAELLEQVARASGAAHRRGIIHRDIKPANIVLMTPQDGGKRRASSRPQAEHLYGIPKLTDFGLVRRLNEEPSEPEGMVVGTPSYMSPEQIGGKSQELGPPTDIWCLGATLYEMLTGQPPFRATNILEVLNKVRQDPVRPPSKLRPGLSPALEAICMKCLEKDPARRYPTGEELADDLRRFLDRSVSIWTRFFRRGQ